MAAAELKDEVHDTNRVGFELSDDNRRMVYDIMRTFVPVQQDRTPRQYVYWQRRNPEGIHALRDYTTTLPELELKAVRYLNARMSDEVMAFTRPIHPHLVLAAMRMIAFHQERGFPLRELELEYIFDLYNEDSIVRTSYRNFPQFNPFNFILIARRWPRLKGNTIHKGAFALDARRFAVAACTMRIQVSFVHGTRRAYTEERGLIRDVGPFHITTIRNGELVVLHRTALPGVWIANITALTPDIDDNVMDVDADVDPSGTEMYKFDWSIPFNAGVLQWLDMAMNERVPRMRTEDTYELEEYEKNHMVSNVPV